MKLQNRPFAGWIKLSAIVFTFVTAVVLARVFLLGSDNKQTASNSEHPHNEISQMTSYTKQGRYDDAVHLGLDLLKNDPSDEIIYQQIADVYLVRAQKEQNQRKEWVTKAVSYVEKSLSFNSKDKDIAGVYLLQDARAFESAADLSNDNKCAYYDKAKKLLEDRVARLQGDQVTMAGRSFPLEPLRKENDKVLAEVKGKVTNAGCGK